MYDRGSDSVNVFLDGKEMGFCFQKDWPILVVEPLRGLTASDGSTDSGQFLSTVQIELVPLGFPFVSLVTVGLKYRLGNIQY